MFPLTSPSTSTRPWRSSAKNTASACASSASAIFPPNSAAARTPRKPAKLAWEKFWIKAAVRSGVRRVEAVTGEGSLRHFRQDHQLERVVGSLISTRETSASPADALKLELEKNAEEIKRLKRELDHARMKSAAASTSNAEENVRVVSGIKVLVHRVDNLERPQMRTLVDNLRNKLGSAVVVLGSASDGKVALIVGVTKDLTARVQAGKIISPIAQKVGGSGGGRPDMAEAGGKDPAALDSALNEAYAVVESLAK